MLPKQKQKYILVETREKRRVVSVTNVFSALSVFYLFLRANARDGKIEPRSFKLALFGTCTTEFRRRYRGLSKQNWISPRRVSASSLNDRVKPNLERPDSRETRAPVNTLVRP